MNRRHYITQISYFLIIFSYSICTQKPTLVTPRLLSSAPNSQQCPSGSFPTSPSTSSPSLAQCQRCRSNCQSCLSTQICSVCKDGQLMFKQQCLAYIPTNIVIGHKQDALYFCDGESCKCQKTSFFDQNLESYSYSKVNTLLDYYLSNSDVSDNEEKRVLNALADSSGNSGQNSVIVDLLIEKILLLDPKINIHRSYVFDLEMNTCLNCHSKIPNCKTCLSPRICLSCFEKFYLTAAGSCKMCPLNVVDCVHSSSLNKLVITKCKSGYYFSRKVSKCLQNKPHCLVQNEFGCLECARLFRLDKISNTCIECGDNCINCPTANTCLECRESFYFDYELSKSMVFF